MPSIPSKLVRGATPRTSLAEKLREWYARNRGEWMREAVFRVVDLDGDPPANIAAADWRKLKGSGLNDDTIADAEIYTERDGRRLRSMLGNPAGHAPAMIFPHFGRGGARLKFVIARPAVPARFFDGRSAKYLAPKGQASRAYFPKAALSAINKSGSPLLITEGIMKALAATQAGKPCIGLQGVWNWCVGGSDPKELIPDLAGIDWQGRTVAIVFDFDSRRNGNVRHAAADLARVLSERGAEVHIPQLPAGPRGLLGGYRKQGLDDFIVRYGEAAFRSWLTEKLSKPLTRRLSDIRQELVEARLKAVQEPGIYLDRSPTGVGKSHADGAVLKSPMINETGSLILLPTHTQCQQVEAELARAGIVAVRFPKLSEETCVRFDEAREIRDQGLSFGQVLCPTCPHADGCAFREVYSSARESPHAIATQKRGELQVAELTQNRQYISIHESPLAMLQPTYRVTRGLELIGLIARKAVQVCENREDRDYYRRMAQIAAELNGQLEGPNETALLPMPARAVRKAWTADTDLHEAIVALDVPPNGDAMRLVRAVTDGELETLLVKVDEHWTEDKGDGPSIKLRRSLVGYGRTVFPAKATVFISDATAEAREIETILGRAVRDKTPRGQVQRKHSVLQIPRDVTRRTTVEKAASILRGILYDIPHRRIGVLTHKTLCDGGLIDAVGTEYAARIAMLDYFGSGQSRGSNDWTENCDALIVLGTPRVPTHAITEHLLRLDNRRAAKRTRDEAGWKADYWSGKTESGRRVTVRTGHYADHDWHAAYCSIVLAELKQSLGRARSILDKGIPVFVMTTEELGQTLADAPFAPLTDVQERVLGQMYTPGTRIRRVCKGPQIARVLGLSPQRVRQVLGDLLRDGRVRHVGGVKGRRWAVCRP